MKAQIPLVIEMDTKEVTGCFTVQNSMNFRRKVETSDRNKLLLTAFSRLKNDKR